MPGFPAPPFVPTATTVNRLSFVRYLYQVAVQQSHQPSPMAVASVLTFHDAVDLFVQLVAETKGVAKAKPNTFLMDNLLEVEKKLGNAASYRAAIGRLNTARNAVKHDGVHPAHHEIEGFRASVTNLFEDYSQLVFGVRFGAMSMVSLVANPRVRERLQRAELAIAGETYEDAIVDVAWSFEVLVHDYESQRADQYGQSLFAKPVRSSHREFQDRKLFEAVEALQSQVRMLALGIDLHRYMAYQQLVPSPWWPSDAAEPTYRFRPKLLSESATEHGCRYCLDFVVDSALRLQGSPIAADAPSALVE